MLGVPLYGHSFKLTNANDNGVGAPSNGPGIAGPYTATNGIIGYNEVRLLIKYNTVFDENASTCGKVHNPTEIDYVS